VFLEVSKMSDSDEIKRYLKNRMIVPK
jgi:hypothetical protein